MSYIVDYSANYAHVDGVEDATLTPLTGSAVNNVKVRRGTLAINDIQGSTIGLRPGDVPFVVWLGTLQGAALTAEATLTVGSVSYKILSVATRGDTAQARIVCRQHA